MNTLQWSSASSSPKALQYPHMTLCDGYLYRIFSYSLKEFLKSCKSPSTNTYSHDCGSVWTRLTDIPVPYLGASVATLRGHVLAIGGSDNGYNPTGAIHCYNR